jgi:hypothetical protein
MSRARDLGSLINSTAAGKNVVINGGFDVWQRGTSFTVNNNVIYTTDRWILLSTNTGGNVVASQQAFTPGSAPVVGYEGSFFLRNTATSPTGASFNVWQHKIEDVRTLAGQTVTLSFWAKADSSRTVFSQFFQNFGTGGSTEVYTGTSYPYSLSTGWQRFTTTLTMPSISGKTVGPASSLRLEFVLPINVSSTIDIWGVQLELGSSATTFSRSGGDIQGEIAKCQRYFERKFIWEELCFARDSNLLFFNLKPLVEMRAPWSMYSPISSKSATSTSTSSQMGFYGQGGWLSGTPALTTILVGGGLKDKTVLFSGLTVSLNTVYTMVGSGFPYFDMIAEL